ncbi:hypothetical protein [Anaerosinus massiliensis]|nr:hypothetical protein [Massilibacillus massiliensis]
MQAAPSVATPSGRAYSAGSIKALYACHIVLYASTKPTIGIAHINRKMM